jgi:hypothetical protein
MGKALFDSYFYQLSETRVTRMKMVLISFHQLAGTRVTIKAREQRPSTDPFHQLAETRVNGMQRRFFHSLFSTVGYE